MKKNQVVGSQKPVSQRAYAKHRGVTLGAVQKAIKSGRLSHALTEDARGHKKILSLEAADNEWRANTRQVPDASLVINLGGDPLDGNPLPEDFADVDPEHVPFQEAHRRLEVEKWLQAKLKRMSDELDLGKRQGELISVDEARDAVIAEYSVLKTKLLGIPSRARQRIPELSMEAVEVLEDLVREALEALSDGE